MKCLTKPCIIKTISFVAGQEFFPHTITSCVSEEVSNKDVFQSDDDVVGAKRPLKLLSDSYALKKHKRFLSSSWFVRLTWLVFGN